MKVYPDPKSPWGKRLWIPDADIEAKMAAAFVKANSPFTPGYGVDVDEILFKVYDVTPDFGDVADECLGRTQFELDGTYTVMINRGLAQDAATSVVARRRLHSTLAHELAHIVFHGVLHLVEQGPGLFDDVVQPKAVMCRQDGIDVAGGSDWWEVQANRGMAAVLLPPELVKTVLTDTLAKHGFVDFHSALGAERGRMVTQDLMQVFDVSFEMMFYRLQGLGFIPKTVGQGRLTE